MSPRTLAALALIAGLVGLAGCKEPTGPEKPIDGERLFAQNCARCHGVDGKGAADAPAGTRDLTAAGPMSTMTDERIKATIRMGKPPNMPAFGNRFAEPSLKVLVAYVRQLAEEGPKAPAKPAPAKVEAAPIRQAPPADPPPLGNAAGDGGAAAKADAPPGDAAPSGGAAAKADGPRGDAAASGGAASGSAAEADAPAGSK